MLVLNQLILFLNCGTHTVGICQEMNLCERTGYLIRRNFRAGTRFARNCAKISTESDRCAKIYPRENFQTYFEKCYTKKSCFSQKIARILVPNYELLWKVSENKSAQTKSAKIYPRENFYE